LTHPMVTGDGDDLGIGDDEIILRRIPSAVYDDNLQRQRPSTQSFKQGGVDGLVSVYLLSETTPAEVATGGPERYLAHLRVGLLRELKLGIVRDLTSGESGHCEITGRKTKSKLNRLAKCAQWVEGYAPME
jgi:hypothetical protein